MNVAAKALQVTVGTQTVRVDAQSQQVVAPARVKTASGRITYQANGKNCSSGCRARTDVYALVLNYLTRKIGERVLRTAARTWREATSAAWKCCESSSTAGWTLWLVRRGWTRPAPGDACWGSARSDRHTRCVQWRRRRTHTV